MKYVFFISLLCLTGCGTNSQPKPVATVPVEIMPPVQSATVIRKPSLASPAITNLILSADVIYGGLVISNSQDLLAWNYFSAMNVSPMTITNSFGNMFFRAIVQSVPVSLTWNASTDTNVIGYVIDAFDSQTNLIQSLEVSNVTQAIITITNPPAKILFAAESFDGLNFSGFGLDLSGYSNFAEYDIIAPILKIEQ